MMIELKSSIVNNQNPIVSNNVFETSIYTTFFQVEKISIFFENQYFGEIK